MRTEHQQLMDELDRDIASLAARIAAATHTLITKIHQFDEAEGWAAQGFTSCAQYLNFRTGLTYSAAYDHVRMGKALAELPQIDAAFAAGTISFSKVRALTRIAKAENEGSLLAIANETTAAQLEKLVRSYRRAADDYSAAELESQRYLSCRFDADGSFVFEGRLLPEEGALIMKALESAPTPKVKMERTKRLADALVHVVGAGLDQASGTRTRADRHQVIVHVDAEVLADASADGRADVGGVGVSGAVAQRLACDASTVMVTHDKDGKVVDVGRRSRTVSTRLRRRLAERDQGCRFPGCGNQVVDAHHLKHWGAGGETTLDNLVTLCRTHHGLVHEHGFSVSGDANGEIAFRTPTGQLIAQRPTPLMVDSPLPTIATQEMPLWRGDRIDYGYVVADMLGGRH